MTADAQLVPQLLLACSARCYPNVNFADNLTMMPNLVATALQVNALV